MKIIKGDPARCCTEVWRTVNNWGHSKQCDRKWSVTKDGKHYCKQHDPDTVKKREAQRSSQWEYDQAKRAMGWYGCTLYDALEKLVDPEATVNEITTTLRKARKVIRAAKGHQEILRKGKPK